MRGQIRDAQRPTNVQNTSSSLEEIGHLDLTGLLSFVHRDDMLE